MYPQKYRISGSDNGRTSRLRYRKFNNQTSTNNRRNQKLATKRLRTIVGGTTRDDSTKLKQKQKHKHHGGPITQQHARIQQSVRT